MGKLFQELKRRKVFRVAAVYSIVAWLIVQIAGEVLPPFNAPVWINQVIIILLGLGLPVALVMAWAIDLAPTGDDSRNSDVGKSTTSSSTEGINSVVLGLLVLSMAFLFVDRYLLGPETDPLPIPNPVLAGRYSINLGYIPSMPAVNNFDAEVAISPDGSRLIYAKNDDGDGDGPRSIWMRNLDSLESELFFVANNGRGSQLNDQAFSPDGKQLLVRTGGDRYAIVDVESGLARYQAFEPLEDIVPVQRGSDWYSNQEAVVATSSGDLAVFSLFTGEGRLLGVQRQSNEVLTWPQVLENGRYILYTAQGLSSDYNEAEIRIFDQDRGESRTLIQNGFHARFAPPHHLVFVRDSQIRAIRFDFNSMETIGSEVPMIENLENRPINWGRANFSISDNGNIVYVEGPDSGYEERQYMLSKNDQTAEQLDLATTEWATIRLSPDGQKLLLQSIPISGVSNTFVYDLEQEILVQRTYYKSDNPVWMPDSQRFVYTTYSDEGYGLWRMSASGQGSPELLFSGTDRFESFAFTPDGTGLFLTKGTPGSEDIYFMDFNGNELTTTPIVVSTRNDTNVSVSPHGNWLAFESRNEIFILPFPNSEQSNPIQVTSDSGEEPRWGPDGNQIYYYLDGNLMRISIDAESGSRVGAPEIVLTGLSSHGRAFYFDISRDGNSIVYPTETDGSTKEGTPKFASVILVDNWAVELDKLVR